MPRFYALCASLAIGLFGVAQFKGWSAFETTAQEFARVRAEQAAQAASTRSGGGVGSSRSSGTSGGFSGK